MTATEFLNRVGDYQNRGVENFALGALAGAIQTDSTDHVFDDTLAAVEARFELSDPGLKKVASVGAACRTGSE